MLETYTDDNGDERCDNCGDTTQECVCACSECGDGVAECACDEGPTYPAVYRED
jgi:hypothetical protein